MESHWNSFTKMQTKDILMDPQRSLEQTQGNEEEYQKKVGEPGCLLCEREQQDCCSRLAMVY